MATQLQRLRIRPTWKAGLRRGRERDSMTEYLAQHPELERELLRALQDVRARGYEPVCLRRVKQPFDFERGCPG